MKVIIKPNIHILVSEFRNDNRVVKTLYEKLIFVLFCKNNIKLRQFFDELSHILLQLLSLSVVDVMYIFVIVEKKVPM